jgi:hypothetical protein
MFSQAFTSLIFQSWSCRCAPLPRVFPAHAGSEPALSQTGPYRQVLYIVRWKIPMRGQVNMVQSYASYLQALHGAATHPPAP